MKPIKLEIQGFFSYVERQEVDFRRLWEAGFFGLIGDTGAGKSALIEAILIALYANSARSGKSPKNLVNPLAADKLSFIQLHFEHKGKLYVARYEVNKGKVVHILELPTGERKIGKEVPAYITQDLLGLSYDDFTLAFVLQQGQFDLFLSKSPKDRAAALQSILHLPLDGLNYHAATLAESIKESLRLIDEQIKPIENQLRENNPEELQKKDAETQKRLKEIESQLRDVDKILIEQETFKSYADQLEILRLRYQEIEKQKPVYEEKKARIEKIESVRLSDLRSLYVQEKGLQQQIERLEAQIKQYEADIQSYRKIKAELQPRIEKIRPDYERREYLRRRKDALQKVAKYRRDERELEELRERIQRGEKLIREKREEIEKLELQIKEREEKRKQLQEKLQRLPTELLQWYAAYENFSGALRRAEEQLKAKEEAFQRAREDAENELRSILQKAEISQPIPANLEAGEDFLRQIEKKIRENIDRLKYEQLAAFLAVSLEPHQACPVCGSTEHPNKAHPDPLYEKRIKSLEELLGILESFWESSFANLRKKALEYHEALKAQNAAQEDSERHRKSFKSEWAAWGHEPDASLSQLNAERQDIEKEQQGIEEEIDEMRKEIEKNRKDLEKYEELLRERQNEYHNKAQDLNAMKALLREVLTEAELQLSENDASMEAQALEKRLEEIKSFEKWERELLDVEARITVAEGELEKKASDLTIEKQNLSDLREDEAREAEKLGLTLQEALTYLEYSEEQLRSDKAEVDSFFAELKSTLDKIDELHQKAEMFDERLYHDKKAEKSSLEKEKAECLRLQGELQSRLSQAQKDKESLIKLMEQAKTLRERSEGFEEIRKLFRAEGFTQYVLSQVLQHLVKSASAYLRLWSRGELELAASDGELDLMVRDHLSEGRLRGIETLSGGQRFQAALALALTLSDLVQYRSEVTEHLSCLIIDEGFGTLDTETLHTVVHTLRDIAMHGRPIGIITHRTEIQAMLPAYVRVERQGRSSVVSFPDSLYQSPYNFVPHKTASPIYEQI